MRQSDELTGAPIRRILESVEPAGAAPLKKAGVFDGLVEADPTIAGLVVAFVVVAAVLYVVFGMGRRNRKS